MMTPMNQLTDDVTDVNTTHPRLDSGPDPAQSSADQPDHALPAETWLKPRLRPHRTLLREVLEIGLLVLLIYSSVNLASARYVVEGASMAPNFHTDEAIIVSRTAYLIGKPNRGDVVVFHNPDNQSTDFIKRIVGLPAETVKITDGRVFINGKRLEEPYIAEFCANKRCDGTWTVGEGQYFVLGDNRSHSHDGHDFGPVDQNLIVGQAWFRYWPPAAFGPVQHYEYGQD
jgi:signal peptidase I